MESSIWEGFISILKNTIVLAPTSMVFQHIFCPLLYLSIIYCNKIEEFLYYLVAIAA